MSYATWNGINFEVTPNLVRSFHNLELSASCETEDKDKNKEKWVVLKKRQPYELTLTMHIDRRTGSNDVQDEAQKILAKAHNGEAGAFTIGGRPMLPMDGGAGYSFMCTSASVTNIELMHNGDWIACDIKLSFKQACDNAGNTTASSGGGGGGSSGSKKKSSKSSSSKKQQTPSMGPDPNMTDAQKKAYQEASKKAEENAKKNNAKSSAKKTTDTAKKQSTSAKKSTNRAKHVKWNP